MHVVDHIKEFGFVGAGQHDAGGQLGVHGVDRHALDVHLVVQVRAGGKAGGAHVGDDLALAHAAALFHARCKAGNMGVAGIISGIVVEENVVAVAAVPAFKRHHAVAAGLDGRAEGRGEVGALMHAGKAQHRVLAGAETAGDAEDFERGFEQQLLFGFAVLVVIVAVIEEGGAALALGNQLRRRDAAGFVDHAVFVAPGLELHLEGVAGLDFAGEVDVPGKQVDKRLDEVGGQARAGGVFP